MSKMTILDGATWHSWRTSSLPMDPPPPVTSTHSPAI